MTVAVGICTYRYGWRSHVKIQEWDSNGQEDICGM